MQDVFENIIEKLEEKHEQYINQYGVVGGNPMAFAVKECKEIVKHAAEEYKYSECGFVSKSDVLKVIEDIKCNDNTPKNYGTLLDIMRKIRILPTVRYIDWIPCSKELPPQPEENPIFEGKNLELYLVTTKYGSNEQDKVYPFRAFWNGISFTDGWHILDVIAWQPLPDTYQENGE